MGPLVLAATAGHIIVIPRAGAAGAALVTTVCAFGGAVASIAMVYKLWRILPPARTVWRSILVCALAYLITAYWPTAGVWVLFKFMTASISIVLLFWWSGEFSAREVSRVRTLLRRQAKTA